MQKSILTAALPMLVAAITFAAGDGETGAAMTTDTTVVASEYNEAPLLVEMVAAGTLPRVEERLPVEPIVVEPYQGVVGQYGGTMNSWNTSVPNEWHNNQQLFYVRLVKLEPETADDGSFQYSGDLADRWEVSADNRVYTFHIREGLKWSDGTPYTTADVQFFWDSVLNNDTARAVFSGPMTVLPGELEVIDALTFRVSFEEPRGTFLFDQARGGRADPRWMEFPVHYLQQYHADHVSEADLTAAMREGGFDTWDQMFDTVASWWLNEELPQLKPWVLQISGAATGVALYTRNPFYWKVDTANNQLPYIDHVQKAKMDPETAAIQTMAGDIDYHWMQFRAAQFPTLKQGERTAPYAVGPEYNFKATEMAVFINQTTSDPVLREIFQNVRFREAVSLAINRDEICDLVFHGACETGGFWVGEYVSFHDPSWRDHKAQYAPDEASRLLDEMGLQWNADRTVRMRPDGKPLEVIFDYPTYRAGFADGYQLIGEYLGDVGIRMTLRASEGSRWDQIAGSNDSQFSTGSNALNIGNSWYLVPFGGYNWGKQWEIWYKSGGAEGWEPPADLRQVWELKDQADSTDSIERRIELLHEATDLFVKQMRIIGILGHDARPSVIHDRLKNVSVEWSTNAMPLEVVPYPVAFRAPEQFWIDPNW